MSVGPHFNPFNKNHGAPTAIERHMGAIFILTDSVISLNGPLSIIGRAVVLHAGTDDLGLGLTRSL
ncbi:superoxide dismutase [Lactifluus subvellereus]|nr:superoxide dismutase [Lactifluus subvellereus]